MRFHQEIMAKAIKLAQKGCYTTHPNPRVGCILIKNKQIIGQGYHYKAGRPHAEREAIKDALQKKHAIAGATAYVTLEPCCHYGKTPPCSDALIEHKISQVVIGQSDPNPLVAEKGIQKLKKAGIEVITGVLQQECEQLNLGFNKRMRQGLPWVRCKLAMSLDGRTAMQSGESKWITGTGARQDVQQLRAQSSAIVTGVGTILADDPSMNVRLENTQHQPLRVILDSHLQTPPQAKLFTLKGPVIIFCHAQQKTTKIKALEQQGALIIPMESTQPHLDLTDVFKILAQQYEVNEILLETGATLAGSALAEKVIDELIVYMAPHIMGDQARGLFHLPELNKMTERINLTYKAVRFVGSDLRFTLTVN